MSGLPYGEKLVADHFWGLNNYMTKINNNNIMFN